MNAIAKKTFLGGLRTKLLGETPKPPPAPCPVATRIAEGEKIKPKGKMVEQVLQYHKQAYPDDFGVILQDERIYQNIMNVLISRKMNRVNTKLRLEPISSTIHATRSEPVIVKTRAGRKLMYKDASGAFRIHLGHGQICHLIRCRLGKGISKEYVVGTNETIRALWLLLETGVKKARVTLPKNGCWEAFFWDGQTAFRPWKLKEEHVSRFRTHPSYDKLAEDIDAFFSDMDFYTRYGQSGMRKVLLTGPPGSGKSSMVMALAVAKAKDMPVIITTDDHFKNVSTMAANLRRPCLIIVEEMDTLIHPDSNDLNFLDGVGTPRNLAGTYLISTTNYPKRIDPRIRKRPGRIDMTMQVGALRMKAAAAVALSYLPPDVTLTPDEVKKLGGVFDRTTPAEIREIIGIAVRLCRPTSKNETPTVLDLAILEKARVQLKTQLNSVVDEDGDTPEEREMLHATVGPIDNDFDLSDPRAIDNFEEALPELEKSAWKEKV
jgi:energy-coupling factor transporter ATP-binding protein EcfA2